MDTHIADIQKLYDQSDESERIGIKKDIRALVDTLEGPRGSIFSSFNAFLQVAIIRVGINLDLFSCLVNSNEAISVDQIAAKTGAAPELLVRLLRHLASVSVVTQVSPTHFSSTPLCSIFATPPGQATITHAFDNVFPSILAFPSFLATNDHRNITDIRHTPFQQASGTSLPVFEYLALPGNEKKYEAFQVIMEFRQDSDWLAAPGLLDDAAKAAQNCHDAEATTEVPFFVDVAGGYGHQCVQLLKKYPWLEGRVVLEDTAEAIGKLKPIHGVKVTVQDFFQEQMVKGARFYYLRQILHDWPPAQAKQILTNLAAALDSESRILIDEIALPDMNASSQACMMDVALMLQFAGVERTRSEWEQLVDTVEDAKGNKVLQIERVDEYLKENHNCLITLKLH